MAQMLLLVNPEKCTGCGTCEVVCSLKHVGECNPARSLIRALRYEKMGSYYFSVPVVCQQCETPLCKEVCPVNAIIQDPETGAYLVDANTCIGCRICTIACPIGAINIDPQTKTASKCDLCNGNPLCAKFCLPEAIIYVKRDKRSLVQMREAAKKLSDRLTLITGGA